MYRGGHGARRDDLLRARLWSATYGFLMACHSALAVLSSDDGSLLKASMQCSSPKLVVIEVELQEYEQVQQEASCRTRGAAGSSPSSCT